MADPTRKPKPGDKLQFPARAFSTMMDAAVANQRSQFSQRGGQYSNTPQSTIIRVRAPITDGSNYFLPGRVIYLLQPLIEPGTDPGQSTEEFYANLAFQGATTPDPAYTMDPDGETIEPPDMELPVNQHRFAIALDPIPMGEVGRAVIDGVCAARITVTNEHLWTCDVDVEATGTPSGGRPLATKLGGPHRILWKESGTGDKHALIRLNDPRPQALWLKWHEDTSKWRVHGFSEDVEIEVPALFLAGPGVANLDRDEAVAIQTVDGRWHVIAVSDQDWFNPPPE